MREKINAKETKMSKIVRSNTKQIIGGQKQQRNYPCACGSGIKYKKCCGRNK